MVTLIVGLAALTLAAVFVALSRRGTVPGDALDTERQERWFVAHAPGRLQGALRHLDRRVAGGAGAAVAFGVVFAAALVVGVLLDAIDRNRTAARVDRSAARWGADHATDTSTRVLEAITQLGSTRWLLTIMALVAIVVAIRQRNLAVAGYLALLGLGISTLNSGLKVLVDRDRPQVSLLTSFSGSSFPSGHSAAAAACWAGLALVLAKDWRRASRRMAAGGAILIAGAVAASRVLLGVHWFTDVVAGMVVGWSWFVLVTLVFGGRLLRFGEPAERVERRSRWRRFGDGASTTTLQ